MRTPPHTSLRRNNRLDFLTTVDRDVGKLPLETTTIAVVRKSLDLYFATPEDNLDTTSDQF